MNTELDHKLLSVRKALEEEGAEALVIGRQSNFSWLSCGGEAHIPLNTERTVAHLVVTRGEFYVLANRIEMPRLMDEALRGLNVQPVVFDWYNPKAGSQALKEIGDPKKMISDMGDFGTRARPEVLQELRASLQPAEVRRYKVLGQHAEQVVREVCLEMAPGQTEYEIAAQVAAKAWARELTPVVLLVATDDRIRKFRHPLPTKKKLKRHAMVVLCARRGGMIVAVSRLVYFGTLPSEIRLRHEAVCLVDATLNYNTLPGRAVKDIFVLGQEAYGQRGFTDEWELHHQGGPTGYEGRDYIAHPRVEGVVHENQAFAWNPSITGTKSEDTILATEKGPVFVTAAQDWPMVRLQWQKREVERPDILVR